MKPAWTGVLSGCLVWVLTFAVLSAGLYPLSIALASMTSFSSGDFVANLISPYVCPKGSTGKVLTIETTTRDSDGSPGLSTDYELSCVDSSGTQVSNTGPAYGWISGGVLAVLGLVLAGILSIFVAVPAGAFMARRTRRRSSPPGILGPA